MNTKKISQMLIMISLNISCGGTDIPTSTSNDSISSFCGGTGTSTDPYLICNAGSFSLIKSKPDSNYKLTTDIRLSGTQEKISKFTGHLDGNQKSVLNLTANDSWIDTNSGTIENISFENLTITSNMSDYVGLIESNSGTLKKIKINTGKVTATSGRYVSSLVVDNEVSGLINDVYCNASVVSSNLSLFGVVGGCIARNRGTALLVVGGNSLSVSENSSYSYICVGGLVGINITAATFEYSAIGAATVSGGKLSGGIIGMNSGLAQNLLSYATVSSTVTTSKVGGVIASNSSGTVDIVENDGDVTGNYVVGGVIGELESSSNVLSNLSNMGTVTMTGGGLSIGGILGTNANAYGTMSKVFSGFPVTASNTSYVGKIAGFRNSNLTISSAYYNSSFNSSQAATGTNNATGITGLTTSQCSVQSNYSGFDFVNIWKITSSGYPTFQ